MVYPVHWYMAFGGAANNGEEQWQCGIRFAGGPLEPSTGGMDEVLLDLAEDVKKFVQAPGSKFPSGHTLTYLKFNEIGPDGLYLDKANSNTYVYSPVINGTATVKQAQQVAMVVTLLTDADHGRGSKGRFYWPGCSFGLSQNGGDGHISSSERDALATAAWTLIQDLGNWPDIDLTGLAPAVVSGVEQGGYRMVSGIRVDDVADTQRRRSRSLKRTFMKLP